jgi:hypothetical protein
MQHSYEMTAAGPQISNVFQDYTPKLITIEMIGIVDRKVQRELVHSGPASHGKTAAQLSHTNNHAGVILRRVCAIRPRTSAERNGDRKQQCCKEVPASKNRLSIVTHRNRLF